MDGTLHGLVEFGYHTGKGFGPLFNGLRCGIDRPAGGAKGAGHALFLDTAEIFVARDIFQGCLGFPNIGIRPVNHPVEGKEHLPEGGVLVQLRKRASKSPSATALQTTRAFLIAPD